MEWIRAMWSYLTGRRQEVDAQQEVINRALAFQRERNERLRSELTSEIADLRGSEARMHDYFAGLASNAGRSRRGTTQ
ncbi:hypothetical protein [Thiomicrorhabdus heinhorstiae]|uniref:Uncharacterized protein n=1 Tax=Thiomicrorhabdus heinhorstiae TaxID=2748010 RepID=A0ABS0C4I0_9GAMM|nr:hypothetical protein [Thiomicrorhabdus heinhorstiae]MBF6059147.1 hypothetical protein [Thiomicrorhabdus heinhorstiae]